MYHRLQVVGLLVLLAAALVLSARSESPTSDEPLHLTRGLAYFWAPDASLSYAHPPLGNAFAALPIVLSEPRQAMGTLPGYSRGEVTTVANALLAPDYERHRHWFTLARMAVALMTLALGLYLYWFCRRVWGPHTALLALSFFALHPTIVAHGRLDTTDLPVTAAMFVVVGELICFLMGGSYLHAATCAVMLGVAVSTKYTALIMIPYCTLLVFGAAIARAGRYRSASRPRALAAGFGLLAAFGITTLVGVNAAYGFDRTWLSAGELLQESEPNNHVTRSYAGELLERESALTALPSWVPIPLPHTYVVGLASIRAHNRQGHSTTFFGVPMSKGHPAYFPVLLAIKTPTVLLLALLAGLGMCSKRRGRVSLASLAIAGLFGLLLSAAMRSSINIGVRHMLPALPLMAVLGGRAAALSLERWGATARHALGFRALATLHASGMLWAFPDYLSDFNALVLGQRGGERISIVGEEWGQDTARLGAMLEARGVERVYFNADNFTGPLELQRFGVQARELRCGAAPPKDAWAAVKARDLARARERCLSWTLDRTPTFEVNGHVAVFEPLEPKP